LFDLSRWLQEVPRITRLSLDHMGLVVPTDSNLPGTEIERDYLLSLATKQRQVKLIKPGFLPVVEALASGEYDAWHFSGHGTFRDPDPNHSGIELECGEQLRASDLSGRVRNLGLARPLVFLNACQVGRAGLSLTDIGGWASQCIGAGAGAFIGAYWSISDQPALGFARGFYDRMLAGQPLARAVREARLDIKAGGDPTWLAYTVYGEPAARLVAED
jgi:CHAT domain-containing protein